MTKGALLVGLDHEGRGRSSPAGWGVGARRSSRSRAVKFSGRSTLRRRCSRPMSYAWREPFGQHLHAGQQLVHHALDHWARTRSGGAAADKFDGDAGALRKCRARWMPCRWRGWPVRGTVVAAASSLVARLAQHVVAVAEAFGLHGAARWTAHRQWFRRSRTARPSCAWHVTPAGSAARRLANEPPQRCREAALAVRGRELAGQ